MTALLDAPASELFGPDIPLMLGDSRGRTVRVIISPDQDVSDPTDDDQFELVTFGRGKLITDSRSRREELFPDGKPTIGLRSKLKNGTAWIIDIFQHGDSVYSLTGTGPQCRWDNAEGAGVLLWNGKPKDLRETAELRTASAAAFLETYTAWANGDCWYVEVRDSDSDEVLDSCGGFIGREYAEGEAARMGNACAGPGGECLDLEEGD